MLDKNYVLGELFKLDNFLKAPKLKNSIIQRQATPKILSDLILELQEKKYVLKKDCPNIGKEKGDCYNNEYSNSIKDLLKKNIIEEDLMYF